MTIQISRADFADMLASGCKFQPLHVKFNAADAGRGAGVARIRHKSKLQNANLKFGSESESGPEPVVTWNAAALMLGVCAKTLRRWSRARLIPKRLVTSDVERIYRAMHNLGRIEN